MCHKNDVTYMMTGVSRQHYSVNNPFYLFHFSLVSRDTKIYLNNLPNII